MAKPKRLQKRSKQEIFKLQKIFYETALELGRNNETRVIEAFTTSYPHEKPIPWIHKVRHANKEEDEKGLDIIFETDVGIIPIQIKGSHIGKTKFQLRYGSSIPVAIVTPSDTPSEIFLKILPLLSRERRIRRR